MLVSLHASLYFLAKSFSFSSYVLQRGRDILYHKPTFTVTLISFIHAAIYPHNHWSTAYRFSVRSNCNPRNKCKRYNMRTDGWRKYGKWKWWAWYDVRNEGIPSWVVICLGAMNEWVWMKERKWRTWMKSVWRSKKYGNHINFDRFKCSRITTSRTAIILEWVTKFEDRNNWPIARIPAVVDVS